MDLGTKLAALSSVLDYASSLAPSTLRDDLMRGQSVCPRARLCPAWHCVRWLLHFAHPRTLLHFAHPRT
jgi:hypothetical protein